MIYDTRRISSGLADVDMIQPLDVFHPHANGLVGMWKVLPTFKGGLTLRDLSLFRNDGTLTSMNSATAWVDGRNGLGALNFVGASSPSNYVLINSQPYDPRVIATNPFSFLGWCWIRTWRGIGGSEIFCIATIGSGDHQALTFSVWEKTLQLIADTTGAFDWNIGTPATGLGIGVSIVPLQTWMNVCVTRGASGLYTAYINGIADGTRTLNTDLVLNNLTMKIGAHYALNTTYNSDGLIDDVRIYSRALSAAEIADVYEDSLTGRYEMLRRIGRRRYFVPSVAPAAPLKNRIIGGGVI